MAKTFVRTGLVFFGSGENRKLFALTATLTVSASERPDGQNCAVSIVPSTVSYPLNIRVLSQVQRSGLVLHGGIGGLDESSTNATYRRAAGRRRDPPPRQLSLSRPTRSSQPSKN